MDIDLTLTRFNLHAPKKVKWWDIFRRFHCHYLFFIHDKVSPVAIMPNPVESNFPGSPGPSHRWHSVTYFMSIHKLKSVRMTRTLTFSIIHFSVVSISNNTCFESLPEKHVSFKSIVLLVLILIVFGWYFFFSRPARWSPTISAILIDKCNKSLSLWSGPLY